MGEAGAWAAHCPTSNSALGSGLFPLRRHVEHGVGVALGSDVGAGTGLFLPKEGLQAYFMQQLLGADGLPLTPVHLLYLATRAGALALGLADRVGDFTPGKDFDAVWLRPADGQHLRGQPRARRRHHRRTRPDLRARHPRRRRRRVAQGGTGLCPRHTDPARQGRSPRPPPEHQGGPDEHVRGPRLETGTRSPAAAFGHMTAAIGVTEAQVNNAGVYAEIQQTVDIIGSLQYLSCNGKILPLCGSPIDLQELPQR